MSVSVPRYSSPARGVVSVLDFGRSVSWQLLVLISFPDVVDDEAFSYILVSHLYIFSRVLCIYWIKSFAIRRVLPSNIFPNLWLVFCTLLESHSFSFIQFINFFLMDRVHGVIISKVQFINFVFMDRVLVVLLSQKSFTIIFTIPNVAQVFSYIIVQEFCSFEFLQLRPVIHCDLLFVKGTSVDFFFFLVCCCSSTVCWGEWSLLPLCCLCSFVKGHFNCIYPSLLLGSLFSSIDSVCFILSPVPTVLMTVALLQSWKSGRISPSLWFFSLI